MSSKWRKWSNEGVFSWWGGDAGQSACFLSLSHAKRTHLSPKKDGYSFVEKVLMVDVYIWGGYLFTIVSVSVGVFEEVTIIPEAHFLISIIILTSMDRKVSVWETQARFMYIHVIVTLTCMHTPFVLCNLQMHTNCSFLHQLWYFIIYIPT